MAQIVARFVSDESGATTVDWVVLLAAVALMGFAFTRGISQETVRLSDDIGAKLAEVDVPSWSGSP